MRLNFVSPSSTTEKSIIDMADYYHRRTDDTDFRVRDVHARSFGLLC